MDMDSDIECMGGGGSLQALFDRHASVVAKAFLGLQAVELNSSQHAHEKGGMAVGRGGMRSHRH
jgi:hypothetical protein